MLTLCFSYFAEKAGKIFTLFDSIIHCDRVLLCDDVCVVCDLQGLTEALDVKDRKVTVVRLDHKAPLVSQVRLVSLDNQAHQVNKDHKDHLVQQVLLGQQVVKVRAVSRGRLVYLGYLDKPVQKVTKVTKVDLVLLVTLVNKAPKDSVVHLVLQVLKAVPGRMDLEVLHLSLL